MINKGLDSLVAELKKITGVKHVLPFGDVVTIDFDNSMFPQGFTDETFVKEIKKVVHTNEFKMLTIRTTDSKKFINLIPQNENF